MSAYLSRSNAYRAKKDVPKAIADLDEAIKLRPKNVQVLYRRGQLYQGQREYGKAITDYDNAITIKADYMDAFIARAVSKAAQENYEGAFADFDEAIKIDGANANPLIARGMVYAKRNAAGDKDKAIADFRKAIEVAKNEGQKRRAQGQLKKLGVE